MEENSEETGDWAQTQVFPGSWVICFNFLEIKTSWNTGVLWTPGHEGIRMRKQVWKTNEKQVLNREAWGRWSFAQPNVSNSTQIYIWLSCTESLNSVQWPTTPSSCLSSIMVQLLFFLKLPLHNVQWISFIQSCVPISMFCFCIHLYTYLVNYSIYQPSPAIILILQATLKYYGE